MEQIEGLIERIRKDRKAISLGAGDWYNFYKPLNETFIKGDKVKITYSEKTVDNIVFKNANSMIKIKNEEPLVEENKNNDKIKQKISDQVLDTLIMQSVQFAKDKNISLQTATENIIDTYKEIIKSI